MKPTRVRDLLALALLAAVITWLLVRTLYGSLPAIPVYAGASLYVAAVIEAILAFVIRSRVGKDEIGEGPGRIHPITVARSVALAKASALVGAASTGVWIGFLVYLLPERAQIRAAVEDTSGAVVGAVAGVALVAAALWLEYCCKAPEDPEDPGEPAA
ncbi:DUF3180 domain-containing protein [Rhodococcus coprophilus]|uniref:Protein of uncharacterized function (DUF3180) n=1 Tax=Rhodococcus coprophilus TaxID=38310 RepID=A0A2X4TYF8_9NOCA|nr:DUF3180 domain-containing protein [Rhodococcus coprophilus]SQI32496.1 Protein of uncharacterised function (DUF3180) [Rhodococcus coprophilus]